MLFFERKYGKNLQFNTNYPNNSTEKSGFVKIVSALGNYVLAGVHFNPYICTLRLITIIYFYITNQN